VADIEIDLEQIIAPKRHQVAPLHQGDRVGAPGELRYQNFSVVMHKTRRVALLTATNIDGESYITIDRKTGLPSTHQAEGETWYLDSRISPSYVIGQDFYSRWSHLFDRGHLTRRNDPTWGQFATRANKDTFHFTNCSPQHWLFNQSLKFWQGIERYVLEQGLFESGRDKPISVLQGPVFNNADDLWADEVQIPSAFWKIVIWSSAGELKAVALVANQTSLFSQVRRGAAPLDGDTPVNVTQWRSSIAAIEKMTGLDLSAIKPYDTLDQSLPTVGEALQLITRWEDIKLSKT
jgi:endonuclease G